MRVADRRRFLAVLIIAVTAVSSATTAHAFVCSRVLDGEGRESGPSLSWFTREIPFTLHGAGTNDIPRTDEFAVLRASFAVWESVQECSTLGRRTDISFHETPWLSTTDRIGYDFLAPDENENLLIFRDAGWPLPDRNIIALTTTTYKPLTGEIFDADIEFNNAVFAFGIDGDQSKMDLMNVAVHEIGHILGLAHTPVGGATMEAQGRYGELDKRSLECDDLDGVVFKYPAGASNGYCEEAIASCGYCAPPGQTATTPVVRVTDRDDGLGGGGCNSGALSGPTLLLLCPLLRWRRGGRRCRH